MTDEASEPISLADEVTKRVLEALRPEFEQIRGEIRAKTSALGQDIDAIAARMTADKASVDDQLNGIRQDISRFSTATKATLDGHTSRFRAITERFDAIDGRLDRLEREPIR